MVRSGLRDARRALTPPAAAVLLLVSALLIGAGYGLGGGIAALATALSGGEPDPEPKVLDFVRLSPEHPAPASPLRSCSIEAAVAQPGALEFHGYAVNAETGEVLFERRSEEANPTASTMKLITAAAALTVLGPEERIPTRVYAGAEPGQVVIVGGGDATLATQPDTFYAGAPQLSELAAQVSAAWAQDPALAGTPITSVSADLSLFGGEQWHPSWNVSDRTEGYISPIASFMVDGDRSQPSQWVSPRSEQPAQRAAAAFAAALGLPPEAAAVNGTAPEGARLLGEVRSQPVRELVGYVLTHSDNDVAEALARLVAIRLGAGNAFDSIEAGSARAMSDLGLDASGLRLVDGSGLSGQNRVPAEFMVSLLQLIRSGAHGLDALIPLLPLSGLTGTLDDRFDPAASGVPGGAIQAKTGWIDEVYALAGYMTAADGSTITFAFYVVGQVTPANRDVLDQIAAQAYACGASLADW